MEAARRDPDSVWSFYRELLTLRRACPSLRRGRMIPREAPEGLWAFTRSWGGADLHVCLNLTDQPIEWSGIIGQVALGSHRPLGERLEGGRLAPYEALVLS